MAYVDLLDQEHRHERDESDSDDDTNNRLGEG